MNQVCLGDIKIQDKRDDSRVTRTESFIYEIRKIMETYKCSWMILFASAFAILSGTLASRDWFNAFCEVRATAGGDRETVFVKLLSGIACRDR